MKKYQIELERGKFYHIFNRGNNSERIFFSERNYEFFLRRYNEYLSSYAETYAFCLLPNHFHFLIRVKAPANPLHYANAKDFADNLSPNDPIAKALHLEDDTTNKKALHLEDDTTNKKALHLEDAKLLSSSPSNAFHRLFTSYSKAINLQQNRHGSLFENPFKRIEITSDEYLKNLVIYIHTNPQLHGFVNNFKTYKWSSYKDIISNNPTIQYHPTVIKWFENKGNFEFCHEQKIDFEIIKKFSFDE